MEQDLLTVNQAARMLNVSRWTIYRWMNEGRIEGSKVGERSVRVFGHSVRTLVEIGRTYGSRVNDKVIKPAVR